MSKSLKFTIMLLFAICAVMVTVFLVVDSGVFVEKDKPDNLIDNTGNDQNQDINPTLAPDVDPVDYMEEEHKITVYLPNKDLDGYEEKIVIYKGNGIKLQERIVEDILFKRLQEAGLITVPVKTNIVEAKIWNETLNINFTKEILDSVVKDKLTEQYILGSIVNTLLGSSDDFMDVQLLIEGNREESIFGHLNTWNPLT